MGKDEIIGLLESGVDSSKVGEAAKEYGIAFDRTPEATKEILDAGASDDLIKTLRSLAVRRRPAATTPPSRPSAPAPAAPPVLMVEVTPGGAQVYVDDEPIGTTSQAGRLKLSQLSPGAHQVRVSLAGCKDFEQGVNLVAGQTTQVSGALEVLSAPPVVSPPASAAPPQPSTASSSEPGALGVQVAMQTPAGERGAHINAVAPGSPAERAGLRAGQSIVSLNGQAVTSPQELLQSIVQYRAGQVVQIGYLDGGTLRTTTARLARRAESAASNPPAASTGTNPLAAVPRPPTFQTYTIAHDHGSGGQDYCVGVLTIAGNMIQYRAANGVHSFEFAVTDIKEAKRNAVYLAALGGFHVRLKQGTNYNLVVLNNAGQRQPPDHLLGVLNQAMSASQ